MVLVVRVCAADEAVALPAAPFPAVEVTAFATLAVVVVLEAPFVEETGAAVLAGRWGREVPLGFKEPEVPLLLDIADVGRSDRSA